AGQLEYQRRFADARVSTNQHQRAWHDAASEHLVELSHGEAKAVGLGKAHLCQWHRLRARDADATSTGSRCRFDADLFLDVAVPVAAFGTATQPFRRLVAALLAGKDRAWPRFHARPSTPGLALVVFTFGRNYRDGLRQLSVRPMR